jgi:hypothetical protein
MLRNCYTRRRGGKPPRVLEGRTKENEHLWEAEERAKRAYVAFSVISWDM